ncbi:MAG: GNAT family N-acetyltransferase [Flavobacteriales bacterium]|nr:GNAT family N-acetyltransferase [Flavobacteriales bacterium]
MKDKIISNTFELYKQIGLSSGVLHESAQYFTVTPGNSSWPSKVFGVNESTINLKELKEKITLVEIPNSVAILGNEELESQLLKHGFILKFTIKGMYLNLQEKDKPNNSFIAIEKVDNQLKAAEFAKIAGESFNCEVLLYTITSLINSSKLRLYVGKHNNKYVSCGMVLLDENNISGLHMIGTLSEYRGLGLGKIMTNKLLYEAYENGSNQVVLSASKSGERIYSKLGFIAEGNLKGYSISL